MWLINTQTWLLEDFTVREISQYAILSHTWTDEEVNLQEYTSQDSETARKKVARKGFAKIMQTCKLAADHNISYAWVDTCCIDKSSSADLTEAINSMWRYYKNAEICYAYLSDLPQRADAMEELSACKWFTRGWTLQELIAPKELHFYDETWTLRGTKDDFAELIHQITNIDALVLRDTEELAKLSIAEKMTWASRRQTTRIEDTAYCLLGIFDINMPLLYGEGNKAFTRLQQEIIKNNNDLSIFGWSPEEPYISINHKRYGYYGESCEPKCGHADSNQDQFHNVLAPSPKESAGMNNWDIIQSVEHSVTNRGIKVDCSFDQVCLGGCYFVGCNCCPHCRKYVLAVGRDRRNSEHLQDRSFGIILDKIGPDVFIRASKRLICLEDQLGKTRQRSIYLLTQTSYSTLDPTCKSLSLEVKAVPGGDWKIIEAMPEARWNSSTRCWYLQNDDEWGMISLRFSDPPHSTICILFETLFKLISIFDSSTYRKEIGSVSQSTSQLQLDDVVAIFSPVGIFKETRASMVIKDSTLRVKVSMGTHERLRGLQKYDRALKVWCEGNRSHCHVQPVLY
jgi:Heterokaryon incompatibility protein (HET)